MRNSIVNDSLHGSIIITDIEKKLVSTTVFNRLHNISQNSTAYLTYPTNRTKRFEHSLGTMHLCNLMFKNGIFNASSTVIEKFIELIKSELRDNGIDLIFDDNIYKEYKDYTNLDFSSSGNDEQKFIMLIVLQSVRLAALLHDIGHAPFSHITEYAFKDVYNNLIIKEKKTPNELKYIKIIEQIRGESVIDIHEGLGNAISNKLLNNIHVDDKYKNCFDVIKQITIRILKSTKFNRESYPATFVLHSLISNTIDADRLDYIFRDCKNSGIDIGLIDYERLLSSMRLVENDNFFYFLVNLKFKADIEEFFNKRLQMYKKVVYHHRVAKTDKLLYDIVKFIVQKNLLDELKNDDIEKLWNNLDIDNKDLDCLFMWDDSYLLSILKNLYLNKTDYQLPDNIYSKIDELVTNNKKYFSVIKTSFDYKDIEKRIISRTNSICLKKFLLNNLDETELEEISSTFFKTIEFGDEFISDLNKKIKRIVVDEVLLVAKKASNGFSDGYKVYHTTKDTAKIIPFTSDVSKIRMKLDEEVRDIQKLFLYVRTEKNDKPLEEDTKIIIDKVIEEIIEKVTCTEGTTMGKLIAVDGPNGSGKTTIIKEVVELLKKDNVNLKIAVTKEPTKSQLGDFTRDISDVLKEKHLARLVNVDRKFHEEEIRHLLKKNDIVITDRYLLSSYILQSIDGVKFSDIEDINSNVELNIDLQIVLNGDANLISERIKNRSFGNRLEKNCTEDEVGITNKLINKLQEKLIKKINKYESIEVSNERINEYYKNSIQLFRIIKGILDDE